MLSKHNSLIRRKINYALSLNKLDYNSFEFSPTLKTQKEEFKNFYIMHQKGKVYLNAHNVIEDNEIILFTHNMENMGNKNTPELALKYIVKILKEYSASLPTVSEKFFDEEMDMYYYRIGYKTYC